MKKQLGSRIPLELYEEFIKKAEELNMNQQEATEAAVRMWVRGEEVKNSTTEIAPNETTSSIIPIEEAPKPKRFNSRGQEIIELDLEEEVKNPNPTGETFSWANVPLPAWMQDQPAYDNDGFIKDLTDNKTRTRNFFDSLPDTVKK